MNAGAYGGQMADVLVSATGLTPAGRRRTLSAAELELGYRHSRFMEEGDMVVSATIRLTSDDPAEIARRMEEFLRRRREKQPLEYPSAGSFFKRPPGHYAGALIEECGLKGFTVGGAQVSESTRLCCINRGGAHRTGCAPACRKRYRIPCSKNSASGSSRRFGFTEKF